MVDIFKTFDCCHCHFASSLILIKFKFVTFTNITKLVVTSDYFCFENYIELFAAKSCNASNSTGPISVYYMWIL